MSDNEARWNVKINKLHFFSSPCHSKRDVCCDLAAK